MRKFKASVDDASNLVNCMDSIKDSLIWILFVEYDNEIRVRLRSRYVPVVDIASQFNGGGHANASGATVYNKKQMKLLLETADNKLKNYKIEGECKMEYEYITLILSSYLLQIDDTFW